MLLGNSLTAPPLLSPLSRVVADAGGPGVPGHIHCGAEPQALCLEAQVLQTVLEQLWLAYSTSLSPSPTLSSVTSISLPPIMYIQYLILSLLYRLYIWMTI